MGDKAFRPKWWAITLVAVLSGVMISLGLWQVERGQAKAELLERFESAGGRPAREVTAGAWAEPGVIELAHVRGTFDGSRQLLLDNQGRNRTPGYRVWTPLQLEFGGIVVVDRGWIPANGDRRVLPDLPVPEGTLSFSGFWRTTPEPGMRLQVDNCAGEGWPRIVQYPTVDELRCLYGEFVANGVLLMNAEAPGGFVREWTSGPELVPTKHYGYAAQWFAFTAVLIGLFIRFSFVRKT